ncbi:unnamed protein product [Rotaria sp. Silwood2]|nr:unnamed protein product [Rotaria sp. Silwood2]CAF2905547.1 unnamed protein product [Rotaria sp. Silwood2]CAF3942345.1 unnamed protein product [Rotaria sp. Silwood2]CAF4392672.1 unnamed protein product [Rotaria sp. Silwood2]
MHLFDKLRASFRRKSNKTELTLSQQIENLLNQSNVSQGDHRLLLLRLVYEHRSRQFDALNVPSNDSKRLEFERSMLKSLLAITSSSSSSSSSATTMLGDKSQSNFQRSSRLYKSMPMATSDLPIIIVEFGQQRQRIKLNKIQFTINELLELFSQTFQHVINFKKYEIFLCNKRIDSMTNIDFSQINNDQRFKIKLKNNRAIEQFYSFNQNDLYASSINSETNEITSLKQRLNRVSMEITEIALLINSIQTNYKNLMKTLIDEDNQTIDSHKSMIETSNNSFAKNLVHQPNEDLTVPPGFKPLSMTNRTSSQDSQSTDEGIDRDTGSASIFESAHSDNGFESIYFECREDATIINEPNPITINDNSKLEWRNQSYRSRPRSHWNSNKVKYQTNYNKEQFGDRPHLKKPINPNKAPLPPEKKKNIPCKYAAGGNCKRGKILKINLIIMLEIYLGSQCRFIHVV